MLRGPLPKVIRRFGCSGVTLKGTTKGKEYSKLQDFFLLAKNVNICTLLHCPKQLGSLNILVLLYLKLMKTDQ